MLIPKEIISDEKYHVATESFNYDERVQIINHSDTFCIFNRWGDIHPMGKKAHGIFYKGTRYLNRLELLLNNKRLVLLSSSVRTENEVLSVDLTNPDIHKCGIVENNIQVSRQQHVRNGVFYEVIDLVNYSGKHCDFSISLSFGADYADIFEIRGMKREVEIPHTRLFSGAGKICFEYTGLDNIERSTEIVFADNQHMTILKNSVSFHIELRPLEKYRIEYAAYFKSNVLPEQREAQLPSFREIKSGIRKDIERTRMLFAGIRTNNANFNNWLSRSRIDLQSLLAETQLGYYPYAGVPWYNTAFGRDGIITAMEVLWIAPQIARDTLRFLAATQSDKHDEANDAEPGKIIHEMRDGEMANTGEVPFKRYYGTIDATPLFLMLAGMYYKQTADLETIRSIWSNILAAVKWMDESGDQDGDGFVEYAHKSKNGLSNQGWKDSHDSVMYANGELCKSPIALCEVQGYVYAAKKQTALLADAMGEKSFSAQLKKSAADLKERFNTRFWDEANGAYFLALDGDKEPCRVLSSNMGHCLFTGIADKKYARSIAEHLMGEDMFSGWGVRTLRNSEVRYNPMSYHNGSVWPHDNALIAAGLARYGCMKEALVIMKGLFDASLFMELQRMPELFCGFNRRHNEGPTAYPVACSPQAWSVGVVFMLLQSCLQLEINGLKKKMVFTRPRLPEFIQHLVVSDLDLGGGDHCHFEIHRHKSDVSFHVVHKPADWEMVIKK